MNAIAAIDCGTNSTRLLVANATNCIQIERLMRITRLGAGVDRSGRLEPDAIDRTIAVLSEYRRVMDRHGVKAVRIAATSAARDAVNREEFFDSAQAVIGTRPELLDGHEEGRLSFEGATAELDDAGAPWLVVDIGGGSTELVAGGSQGTASAGTAATASAGTGATATAGTSRGTASAGACATASADHLTISSLDVGCVRVRERFLRGDPPRSEELEAAAAHVDQLIAEAVSRLPALRTSRPRTMVGLAGTVSSLASIDQQLSCYERTRIHHYILTLARVEEMLTELAAEPVLRRRCRPGLEPQRADVIVGGAIVLVAVMRWFGFERCVVSESDILDGMVRSLL